MKFSFSKKIVLCLIAVSAAITIITSFFQIQNQFVSDKNILKQNMALIEDTSKKSLEEALWNMNLDQLKTQLNGILAIKGIDKVEIWDGDKLILAGGNDTAKSEIKSVKLIYYDNGQKFPIGIFKYRLSDRYIIEKINNDLISIIGTQILKSMIVAFLIYFLINRMVTDPIKNLSEQLKALADISSPKKIKLKRHAFFINALNKDDELNELESSINHIHQQAVLAFREVTLLNNELEEKVLQNTKTILKQREILEYSAKLASLGEMAGGIAHEINNPLTVIKGKVFMLKRSLVNNDRDTSKIIIDFEIIDGSIDRIVNIIKSLKSISRDSRLDPTEVVYLNEILNDVQAVCTEKILNKGVSLKCLQHENYTIKCRKSEVSQVLINLLSNSLDAVENLEEKWIVVDVKLKPEYLTITVTDSGNGIPKNLQEKIFEPYFTTKNINRGSGLGLSISQSLIKNNNGSLEYDQTSEKTRFIIKLPVI